MNDTEVDEIITEAQNRADWDLMKELLICGGFKLTEGFLDFNGSREEVRAWAETIEHDAEEVGFRGECPNDTWYAKFGDEVFTAKEKGDGTFDLSTFQGGLI